MSRTLTPAQAAEYGRRGGLTTARRGSAYMRAIGLLGAAAGGRPRRLTWEEIQRETLEGKRSRVNYTHGREYRLVSREP